MLSSRDTWYLWDKILRVTLQPGEYEILSSVDLGRKKYKLRMLFCSASLGCTQMRRVDTDNSGDLSLRDACFGKPRVCEKELSPKQAVEKEWKEVVKRQTKQQQGKSTLLHWWTSANSKVHVHSWEVFKDQTKRSFFVDSWPLPEWRSIYCKKNSNLSPSTSTIIEYSRLFPNEFW